MAVEWNYGTGGAVPCRLLYGSGGMNVNPWTCLVAAHRGARSLAPENTLAAARKAYDLGADLWELDVTLTRDGVPVVIHDDTLERTTNVSEIFPERTLHPVHTFSLAELQHLDFGSWFNRVDPYGQIASGAVSEHEQASFVGLSIPTLAEALQLTRSLNWRVNVEIKDMTGAVGDGMIVEAILQVVAQTEMAGRVLVSSFNHDYLRRCRRLAPQLLLGALVEGGETGDPLTVVRTAQADAYHPGAAWLREEELQACLQAGVSVNIWTVNEVADMLRWITAGAAALFTDFPQRMVPLVKLSNQS